MRTVITSYSIHYTKLYDKSGGFNNQGSAATIDAFINCPLAIGSFAGETLGGVTCGLGLITDENAGLPEVNISDQFEKETSSAFELGVRSNFLDGRLDIEGAYYHTDVDDMQFFEFFVGTFGLLRVV